MIVILNCSIVEDAFPHLRVRIRCDLLDSHGYAPDFALIGSRERSTIILRPLLLPANLFLNNWQLLLFILSDVDQVFRRVIVAAILILILVIKTPVSAIASISFIRSRATVR